MQAANRSITSRVTVQNPRPRKYASAAEKQAAFRARFPTICVRVEPKTADTVQAIADASGRTQQETLLSMLKYAMTNRNWLTLGLTEHKQLPRKENPIMLPQGSKEKDREAIKQLTDYLADQLRSSNFSVEVNQSGSIAGPSNYLKISDPLTGRFIAKPIRISTHSKGPFEAGNVLDIGTKQEADNVIEIALNMRAQGPSELMQRDLIIEQFVKKKIAEGMKPKQAYKLAFEQIEDLRKANPMKRKPTPAQIAARERFAAMARSGAFKKKAAKARKATDDTRTVSQKLKEYAINNAILERVQSGQSVKSAYDAVLGKGAYERLAGELYGEIRKTKSNPAKKTVSQKISQLTREGYPQRQAVAIALNEERAGKVKRNPIKKFIVYTETKPGNWKQVRVTENLDVAKDLAKSNAESGYPSIVEDATGAIVYTPKVASNPQARSVKHTGARNIAYAVQAKRMLAGGGSQFEMIAGFPTKAQAQDYIDALLKSYPKGLTLRISAA